MRVPSGVSSRRPRQPTGGIIIADKRNVTETSDKTTEDPSQTEAPRAVEIEIEADAVADTDADALQGEPEAAPTVQAEPPFGTGGTGAGAESQKKVLFDQPFFRGLAITWGGIVAALSLSPVTPQSLHQIGDKAEHYAAYALLSFLVVRGWIGTRFLFLIFLGVLGFGGLMEGLQYFVPGRSMEMADVLANAFGTVTGLVVAAVWISVRANKARRARAYATMPPTSPGVPPQ
jgi:VanZ family protein